MKRFIEILKNPVKYIRSVNSICYDFNLFNMLNLTSSMLASVILFLRFPLNGIMLFNIVFSFLMFRMEHIIYRDFLNLIIELVCKEHVYKEQINILLLPFIMLKNFILIIIGIISWIVPINLVVIAGISYSIFVAHMFLVIKYKFKIAILKSCIVLVLFIFTSSLFFIICFLIIITIMKTKSVMRRY